MPLLALGFVVLQAVVGLMSHSAAVYLAQPVLLNAAFGVAFLVSAMIGRPLAGVFARQFWDAPGYIVRSRAYRRVSFRTCRAMLHRPASMLVDRRSAALRLHRRPAAPVRRASAARTGRQR